MPPKMPIPQLEEAIPHSVLVWRDRWGRVKLTEVEWDRLKWWEQIRYKYFGVLPADFERDSLID